RRGTYDLGNPHLVLLVADPEAVDLAAAGSFHEASFSRGINVHFVAPTPGEPDAMSMRVWERGAGVTEACGTGAVAVARAAHDWGLVGDDVTIHMPGGDVAVVVGDPMVLVGPATYVADVELEC
ncbi:MAG: diaminopimelate epimerase, partial [Acidimicrobiales bacterium]|nr:diaminopimelate epimerase [Acidimicrobiales bacterium]